MRNRILTAVLLLVTFIAWTNIVYHDGRQSGLRWCNERICQTFPYACERAGTMKNGGGATLLAAGVNVVEPTVVEEDDSFIVFAADELTTTFHNTKLTTYEPMNVIVFSDQHRDVGGEPSGKPWVIRYEPQEGEHACWHLRDPGVMISVECEG